MKKLGLMLCLAVAPLLGAACSSTSAENDGSTSNDGSTGGDTGGSQFFLSRGTNNYTVTTAAVGNDGCMLDPGSLKNTTLPVNAVDGTMNGVPILTISIG